LVLIAFAGFALIVYLSPTVLIAPALDSDLVLLVVRWSRPAVDCRQRHNDIVGPHCSAARC
jgi:hypothetical protein